MGLELSYVDTARAENENEARLLKAAKGGSYLAAMALLTAKISDSITNNLLDKAAKLDGIQQQKKDAGPGGAGNLGENVLTAEIQIETQRLNMFMQAMNNAMKTFGESNSTLARKGN